MGWRPVRQRRPASLSRFRSSRPGRFGLPPGRKAAGTCQNCAGEATGAADRRAEGVHLNAPLPVTGGRAAVLQVLSSRPHDAALGALPVPFLLGLALVGLALPFGEAER